MFEETKGDVVMTNWKSLIISMLEDSEDTIPHMYCDTEGYVTIGTGFLLLGKASVDDVVMHYPDTLDIASTEDKRSEWEYTKAKFKPNMLARYYKKPDSLVISGTTNKLMLEKKVEYFKGRLIKEFGVCLWSEAPDNAKAALLDMAYNLGVTGIVKKFPTFTKHLINRNWEGCAKECSRKDVSDERNEEVRHLFLSCVK